MSKVIFSAVVIVIVTVTVYFFRVGSEQPDGVGADLVSSGFLSNEAEARGAGSSVSLEEQPVEEGVGYSLGGHSATELYKALEQAVKNREGVEEAMRVIEMKLSALESQLDDLETLGGDPVDVEGETLDAFEAIFVEYQDIIIAYEKAASKEAWTEEKVRQAGL